MLHPLTPEDQSTLDTLSAVVQAAATLAEAMAAVPYVEALAEFERMRAAGTLRFDLEAYPIGTPPGDRRQVPMSRAEADDIDRLLRPFATAQATFRRYRPDGATRDLTARQRRATHRGRPARPGRRAGR